MEPDEEPIWDLYYYDEINGINVYDADYEEDDNEEEEDN